MEKFEELITNIASIEIIDIIFAIGIIIFFRIFSSWIAYFIIRCLSGKKKVKKR